jgi:D-glycero-D-manno-heptose 1,7-bisphosphate phosphatase
MAGGKGTRIADITKNIPKPMLPLAGKPILEYQIENLVKAGLGNIVLITGHLGGVIHEYFRDGGKFGATIAYYQETDPLGTAGGLFKCIDSLGDSFFLINGDIIFDVNLKRIIEFHTDKDALATLVTHPNSHPYDSAVLETDASDRIIGWRNKEDDRPYYRNLVNSGIHVLTKKLLSHISAGVEKQSIDLDREILQPLLATGRIYSYKTPEYIKDIGTPERFCQVEGDIKTGRVSAKNLEHTQRAVFLDRDGVINVPNGFIKNPDEFELIDGVTKAIGRINQLGYLAIVVTNQPVIARGECTEEGLAAIHRKMETELGKEGAYLDDIFYCPHHPDGGFSGELPEYKIDCACRKPKPGMLIKAAEKYNIDLSKSWMVGDDERDIQAGLNAGCKTAFIKKGNGYNNLLDFVQRMERS